MGRGAVRGSVAALSLSLSLPLSLYSALRLALLRRRPPRLLPRVVPSSPLFVSRVPSAKAGLTLALPSLPLPPPSAREERARAHGIQQTRWRAAKTAVQLRLEGAEERARRHRDRIRTLEARLAEAQAWASRASALLRDGAFPGAAFEDSHERRALCRAWPPLSESLAAALGDAGARDATVPAVAAASGGRRRQDAAEKGGRNSRDAAPRAAALDEGFLSGGKGARGENVWGKQDAAGASGPRRSSAPPTATVGEERASLRGGSGRMAVGTLTAAPDTSPAASQPVWPAGKAAVRPNGGGDAPVAVAAATAASAAPVAGGHEEGASPSLHQRKAAPRLRLVRRRAAVQGEGAVVVGRPDAASLL